MPWLFIWKNTIYGNFQKNPRKIILTLFGSHFLTNWDKNEDEDEKIWENEFDIWILCVKITLYKTFHENLRNKAFFEIFTRTEVSKGLKEEILLFKKRLQLTISGPVVQLSVNLHSFFHHIIKKISFFVKNSLVPQCFLNMIVNFSSMERLYS